MDASLVTRRLGQYGAAWLCSFLLTLILGAALVYGLGFDVASAADALLSVALPVLALAVVGVAALTLAQPGAPGAKAAVLGLAVLLLLPLLWAPVLGAVVLAWLAGAAIEYSAVYAAFRIAVSQLLYPVVASIVSGAALRLVWDIFQVVATVVGTIASAIQVWTFFRKLMRPRPFARASDAVAVDPPPPGA